MTVALWSELTADEVAQVPQLAGLVAELGRVSCTCPHPVDIHRSEVLRLFATGQVLRFRLGPCPVRDCRCQGGRS